MAILTETAHKWAKSQGSLDDLRRAVKERLLAAQPHPVGSARIEEFPEDVVIALLQEDSVSDELQGAVVLGWKDACDEVSRLLTWEFDETEREQLRRPFTRVYRTAALTGHPGLRFHVRQALINALVSDTLVSKRQVQEVVSAAIAYPDAVDRGQWQMALKEKPELVAYAFRALLEIDKESTEAISIYFGEVLRKQFVEKIDLNSGFLAAFVPNKMGTDNALRRAVEQFKERWPSYFSDLLHDTNNNKCWPETIVEYMQGLYSTLLLTHYTMKHPLDVMFEAELKTRFGQEVMEPAEMLEVKQHMLANVMLIYSKLPDANMYTSMDEVMTRFKRKVRNRTDRINPHQSLHIRLTGGYSTGEFRSAKVFGNMWHKKVYASGQRFFKIDTKQKLRNVTSAPAILSSFSKPNLLVSIVEANEAKEAWHHRDVPVRPRSELVKVNNTPPSLCEMNLETSERGVEWLSLK